MIRLPGCQIVRDLADGAEQLRESRYGVIEVVEGQLRQIVLRPWPKQVSPWEMLLTSHLSHRFSGGDRIQLYYNQPRSSSKYLALKFAQSSRDTSLATFFRSLMVLDHIAELKRSDGIVCEITNYRISDRLLERLGWERHTNSRLRRNFIKRFYGVYPRYDAQESASSVLTNHTVR